MTVRHFLVALLVSAGAALAETPEQTAALREIDAFTVTQMRTDPHFKKIEAEILEKIDPIVTGSPASAWLPGIRSLYFAVAERVYREEREAIAVEERAAFSPPPIPDSTWTYYERRLGDIAKGMEAGRYGPRGGALRALEAAKLYFPNDQSFLVYRQTRVSLATAYEMGRISREEFDERWARAGEAFLARQRTDDQARARMAIEAARGELEILRSFQDRMPTTCTSRVVLGRLQTTCR